jgi:hypothetical protein
MTEPFQSKHADLEEAMDLLLRRYPDRDPLKSLIAACREGPLICEILDNQQGWVPLPASWWHQPDISWPGYAPGYGTPFKDLRFQRTDLDALWPDTGSKAEPRLERVKNPGNQLRKHDWDGALIDLIHFADFDGLLDGPDAQAKIGKLISNYFVETTADQPSDSQIRAYASRIVRHKRINRAEN